jgi:hypothetical protein
MIFTYQFYRTWLAELRADAIRDEVMDEHGDVMVAMMLERQELVWEQVKHKFISQTDERVGSN